MLKTVFIFHALIIRFIRWFYKIDIKIVLVGREILLPPPHPRLHPPYIAYSPFSKFCSRFCSNVLLIIKFSDRLPTLFETTTLFYQTSWVKPEPPFFGGGILKIWTLLYKGGESQLWTRLLISFSQDCYFLIGLNCQLSFFWINL